MRRFTLPSAQAIIGRLHDTPGVALGLDERIKELIDPLAEPSEVLDDHFDSQYVLMRKQQIIGGVRQSDKKLNVNAIANARAIQRKRKTNFQDDLKMLSSLKRTTAGKSKDGDDSDQRDGAWRRVESAFLVPSWRL